MARLREKEIVLFLLVVLVFVFLCILFNSEDTPIPINHESEEPDWPVIRSWTPFFGQSLAEVLQSAYDRTTCEFRCIFVDRDNENYPITDAYVFHSRDLNKSDLAAKQNSNQLFVLFGSESPYNFGNEYLKLPPNYFDGIANYRMDADYRFPYFSYVQLKDGEKPMWNQFELTSKLKSKSGIAVINSNCETKSKREKYINEFSNYINITKKGECYNTTIEGCPRYGSQDCLDKFLAQFKFYLAFENSVCQDYVTEKFSYQSQMLIPIVLKRSVVERILPKNEKMFLAADDFKTPKKLAEYLIFLENNNDEYIKYFDWVKRYRLNTDSGGDAMCKLCEDIYRFRKNKSRKRKLTDTKKFIVDGGKCQDNYSETLLTNNDSYKQ